MSEDIGRVALTKILRNGRTAVVTVKPIGYLHSASTTVTVDGREVGSHLGPHHAAPRAVIAAAGSQYVAAIGPLLLTADECAQIEQVYNEVSAAIPPDLTFEREQLVRMLDGAEMDKGINAAGRFDQDYANPFGGPEAEEDERRITEARDALAAFDAGHPEIAEQATAQRSAAARRALEGRD